MLKKLVLKMQIVLSKILSVTFTLVNADVGFLCAILEVALVLKNKNFAVMFVILCIYSASFYKVNLIKAKAPSLMIWSSLIVKECV